MKKIKETITSQFTKQTRNSIFRSHFLNWPKTFGTYASLPHLNPLASGSDTVGHHSRTLELHWSGDGQLEQSEGVSNADDIVITEAELSVYIVDLLLKREIWF